MRLESVLDVLQHDLTRMVDKAEGSVVLVPFFGSVITRDSVHVVGHSPGLQILLQIEVRMASPALTNSDGMLSTAADFPIFSALTAASTSSRRIG